MTRANIGFGVTSHVHGKTINLFGPLHFLCALKPHTLLVGSGYVKAITLVGILRVVSLHFTMVVDFIHMFGAYSYRLSAIIPENAIPTAISP